MKTANSVYGSKPLDIFFLMKCTLISDVHTTEFIVIVKTFQVAPPHVEDVSVREGVNLAHASEYIPLIG